MRTVPTARTAALVLAAALLAASPGAANAQPAVMGSWAAPVAWPNVAIHTQVLPTGKVLFWSRREAGEGLDPQDCQPRIWDPAANAFSLTPKPGYNLFCSGHTFLPDGRLFVVGGHIADSHGSDRTSIYDPIANTWTATEDTSGGRWYPTATALPDGSVLVSFGSRTNAGDLNDTQQVWKDGHYRTIVNFIVPPLYPRMHVVPDGRVFMSGPLALTQFLDTAGGGQWQFLKPAPDPAESSRLNNFRDYAPAVMFEPGKILYVVGGNPPTAAAEVLDLTVASPRWTATGSMRFARRQHNATLLPDGTVLVTGGTQGGGFDNLNIGSPIRAAEVWDPRTGGWTVLAEESVDRCYHSTAVLLPDATVLSAGGGEFRPVDGVDQANDPRDTHKDAQVFSPPYLFKCGARPVITNSPAEVALGATITVDTAAPARIAQVSWLRLSSVTHSFNMGQRINFLTFTADTTSLHVKAPADASVCPPGYYMMFLLDRDRVPSVARMIRFH